MDSVIVSVAVNCPDNGQFDGRCTAIEYNDMELRHDDWLRGCAFAYLGNGYIRVSRRLFKTVGGKEWYGNWCWDAVAMERKEARRLLRYIRDSGHWHCESAPTRLYNWFNGSPVSAHASSAAPTTGKVNKQNPAERENKELQQRLEQHAGERSA